MRPTIILFILWILIPATLFAQVKTDLETMSLSGKVRTVKIERARFVNDSGQLTEGKRQPYELITFDSKGYYTERAGLENGFSRKFADQYYPDGKLKLREDLIYGENQLFTYKKDSVTRTTQLRDGHVLDREVYSLDDAGRIVREDYYLVDKNLGRRLIDPPEVTKRRFDSKGRLIEIALFKSSGEPAVSALFSIHRYVSEYDDAGHLASRVAYKTDGTVGSKWVYSGREGIIWFGPNGKPNSKTVYADFDQEGNWTRSTAFKLSDRDGKTVAEPTEAEYRTITYF